jgi:hypothetical protein
MKKPSGHEDLLKELFDESAPEHFRGATLERGLAAVRRVRRRRMLWRAVPVLVALVLATTIARQYWHRSNSTTPAQVARPANVIPGTDIRVLSDEELLAFFKGRPVGLVGPPENQRLVLFDQVSN